MELVGTATVEGIGGNIRYSGVAALLGNLYMNDVSFTDNFNTSFLYNRQGNVTGCKVSNRMVSVDILFTPIGVTSIAAKSMITLINPYSRVILSNFPSTFNGVYCYSGGMTVVSSNTKRTIVSIPIVAFPDGISSYQLSTVIKKTL